MEYPLPRQTVRRSWSHRSPRPTFGSTTCLHPPNFVTPLLGYTVYLHTGHHSFLPWLQYPAEYLACFKNIAPTVHQLTRLLIKLPPLLSSHAWSARWLADTPLRCALVSTVPSHTASFSISTIPINYIVPDVYSWSYFYKPTSCELPLFGPEHLSSGICVSKSIPQFNGCRY